MTQVNHTSRTIRVVGQSTDRNRVIEGKKLIQWEILGYTVVIVIKF